MTEEILRFAQDDGWFAQDDETARNDENKKLDYILYMK